MEYDYGKIFTERKNINEKIIAYGCRPQLLQQYIGDEDENENMEIGIETFYKNHIL